MFHEISTIEHNYVADICFNLFHLLFFFIEHQHIPLITLFCLTLCMQQVHSYLGISKVVAIKYS